MTRGWDSDFGRSIGEAAKMNRESPARRSEGDVPLLAAANQPCTISVRVVGFVLQIPVYQLLIKKSQITTTGVWQRVAGGEP